MDQEQFDELNRLVRRNEEQFEAFCKKHNLNPEQRQEFKDLFEMDSLVIQENARQLQEYLESEDPGMRRTAGIFLIDLIREETNRLIPLIEATLTRIEILEARLANAPREITAHIRAEIDRKSAKKTPKAAIKKRS